MERGPSKVTVHHRSPTAESQERRTSASPAGMIVGECNSMPYTIRPL